MTLSGRVDIPQKKILKWRRNQNAQQPLPQTRTQTDKHTEIVAENLQLLRSNVNVHFWRSKGNRLHKMQIWIPTTRTHLGTARHKNQHC